MIKLKELLTNVPSQLYHATLEGFINSIARKGIIPGGSTIQPFNWCNKKYVYLCANSDQAREIISSSDNPQIQRKIDTIQILTIDTSKLDKRKFSQDTDEFLKVLGIRSYRYEGIILPNAIIDYGD